MRTQYKKYMIKNKHNISFTTGCAYVMTAIFQPWGQKWKTKRGQSAKMEKSGACDGIIELQISKPWSCATSHFLLGRNRIALLLKPLELESLKPLVA